MVRKAEPGVIKPLTDEQSKKKPKASFNEHGLISISELRRYNINMEKVGSTSGAITEVLPLPPDDMLYGDEDFHLIDNNDNFSSTHKGFRTVKAGNLYVVWSLDGRLAYDATVYTIDKLNKNVEKIASFKSTDTPPPDIAALLPLDLGNICIGNLTTSALTAPIIVPDPTKSTPFKDELRRLARGRPVVTQELVNAERKKVVEADNNVVKALNSIESHKAASLWDNTAKHLVKLVSLEKEYDVLKRQATEQRIMLAKYEARLMALNTASGSVVPGISDSADVSPVVVTDEERAEAATAQRAEDDKDTKDDMSAKAAEAAEAAKAAARRAAEAAAEAAAENVKYNERKAAEFKTRRAAEALTHAANHPSGLTDVCLSIKSALKAIKIEFIRSQPVPTLLTSLFLKNTNKHVQMNNLMNELTDDHVRYAELQNSLTSLFKVACTVRNRFSTETYSTQTASAVRLMKHIENSKELSNLLGIDFNLDIKERHKQLEDIMNKLIHTPGSSLDITLPKQPVSPDDSRTFTPR